MSKNVSEDLVLTDELTRLEDAFGEFFAKLAGMEINHETATDALRRRLFEFRKELKYLDRVSMDTLHRVRSLLGPSPRLEDEAEANVVLPDRLSLRIERDRALERLRDFSRDAEKLIIADPYFFAGECSQAPNYVSEIIRATTLKRKGLKKIHVIFDSRCGETKSYCSLMKKVCSENGVTFSRKDTSIIHDRFWIKDRKLALIIGTSIGGLGRRLSYITPMLNEDLKETLDFLRERKLL